MNWWKRFLAFLKLRCDICGKPSEVGDRLVSDGVGIKAHCGCMDRSIKSDRDRVIEEALDAIANLPPNSYRRDLNEPDTVDMHIAYAEMQGHESAFRAIQELKR